MHTGSTEGGELTVLTLSDEFNFQTGFKVPTTHIYNGEICLFGIHDKQH